MTAGLGRQGDEVRTHPSCAFGGSQIHSRLYTFRRVRHGLDYTGLYKSCLGIVKRVFSPLFARTMFGRWTRTSISPSHPTSHWAAGSCHSWMIIQYATLLLPSELQHILTIVVNSNLASNRRFGLWKAAHRIHIQPTQSYFSRGQETILYTYNQIEWN